MGFMSPAGYPGFGDRTCWPDLTPPRYGCTITLIVFDKSLVQFIAKDEESLEMYFQYLPIQALLY